MTEAFLHYIWQFQYFNKSDLLTTSGEPVLIFHAGHKNIHAGPDFFNAKIKIGEMEWNGNAEIHINSSGWVDHKHEADRSYDNVILHIVWKEDRKIIRRDGSELPTIELKNRVQDSLFIQYKKLVNNPEKIPCASHFENVPSLTKFSMLDKALMQRLESKAMAVQSVLKKNNNDWEEMAYHVLAKNFGFKVNADPFVQLAQALPYKIILKHADQQAQIEALLFGQAGFLEGEGNDDYFLLLKREFSVLRRKFTLLERTLNVSQWKFLRMRPANFPTIRIAQLAAVIKDRKNIFSRIIAAKSYQQMVELFSVDQSFYWKHHYQFFKAVDEEIPPLGKMSIDNIIINTAIPLLVTYGKVKDEQEYVDLAIEILQHIVTEDNTIIKTWKDLGMKSNNAADSQALIELHNSFCVKRRCLDCSIGFTIIQSPAK